MKPAQKINEIKKKHFKIKVGYWSPQVWGISVWPLKRKCSITWQRDNLINIVFNMASKVTLPFWIMGGWKQLIIADRSHCQEKLSNALTPHLLEAEPLPMWVLGLMHTAILQICEVQICNMAHRVLWTHIFNGIYAVEGFIYYFLSYEACTLPIHRVIMQRQFIDLLPSHKALYPFLSNKGLPVR